MAEVRRWFLRGTLETRSPLHIGSGNVTTREGLLRDDDTREHAEVQAVALDYRSRPYLPSTALKGALRRLCAGSLPPEAESEPTPSETDDRLERLFGGTSRGSGLTVHDAFLDPPLEPEHPPPFWSPERQTGVQARVALQRIRGTASPQRLFHLELVPPGATFQVDFDGNGLSMDDLAWLLAAVETFQGTRSSPALGARSADGWGRLRWQETSLTVLDEATVLGWLTSGQGLARDAAVPLDPEGLDDLRTRVESVARQLRKGHSSLGAELELAFDGIFLVRDSDPERCGKGSDRPDTTWRRDTQGRVVLPASSLRGSLRAHAERILRTLGGVGAACGNEAPRPPCPAVQVLPQQPEANRQQVRDLCPACRVFGAPGWRSPLRLEDFTSDEPDHGETRHFVAIDRFTGGAARHRKFQLDGVRDPVLKGSVHLDLDALTYADVGPWALAWFALLLRDVVDGDVTFGAGASKGQGSCRGLLGLEALPVADLPAPWRHALAPQDVDTVAEVSPFDLNADDEPHRRRLEQWARDLEALARQAHQSWTHEAEEAAR